MATRATYNAPDGDEQVVVMQGVRFFDGQSTEFDERLHAGLIDKLRTNQHFDLEEDGTEADDSNEAPKTGW